MAERQLRASGCAAGVATRMGLRDRLPVPLSWLGVIRRTSQRTLQDNCLGLAAELAYFFFLALFPALLFFVALASFFPIDRLADHAVLGRPFDSKSVAAGIARM